MPSEPKHAFPRELRARRVGPLLVALLIACEDKAPPASAAPPAVASSAPVTAPSVTAAPAEAVEAPARKMTPAQRSEKMRAECRDDGTCTPGWVFELLSAAEPDPKETAALEKLCLDARNAAVKRARGHLAKLQELERQAKAITDRSSEACEERRQTDWRTVDAHSAELNRMAAEAPGVAMLRMAAGNVRACFACSESAPNNCARARELFGEAQKDLAKPQRKYCTMKDTGE